jgi:hypothetical protein
MRALAPKNVKRTARDLAALGNGMSPCACSLSEKTKMTFQKKEPHSKKYKRRRQKKFLPLPDRQHRLNHVDRSAAHRGRSDLALSDPPS